MLYHSCTTKTSVDLAHYGVSRAKDWVSLDCGTIAHYRAAYLHLKVRGVKELLF